MPKFHPIEETPQNTYFRYIYANGEFDTPMHYADYRSNTLGAVGWMEASATVEEVDNRPKLVLADDGDGWYCPLFKMPDGKYYQFYQKSSNKSFTEHYPDSPVIEIPTSDSVEWLQ